MTEQETEIKRVISYIRSCREAGIDTTITIDKSRNHFILNALEEIQQYRALGTVEELQKARERQIPKNAVKNEVYSQACPDCGYPAKWKFCANCGRALKY